MLFLTFCALMLAPTAQSASNCSIRCSDDFNGTLPESQFVFLPDYGCIQGTEEIEYREFLSIPFAKQPTVENNLRWKRPEMADSWDCLETTELPPSCMQPGEDTEFGQSEACLYANVWTPINYTKIEDKSYPVMVFIYGGAYRIGSSSEPSYAGSEMATINNVIVVTFNYRLGSFGFLYSDEYGFEGNYGYYDQLFAIKWIYNNIGYFGGDNSKIVIFGESAGAQSVGNVLLNYGADTQDEDVTAYFSGAIMESPPFGVPQRTKDDWDTIVTEFVKQADCTDTDPTVVTNCLLSRNSTFLKDAQVKASAEYATNILNILFSVEPWTPTFETDILPQKYPIKAFEDGEYNKNVPIIIGTNKDEMTLFVAAILGAVFNKDTDELTSEDYEDVFDAIFGESSDDIRNDYNVTEVTEDTVSGVIFDLLNTLFNEIMFQCPAQYSALKISETTNSKGYLYNFWYYYKILKKVYKTGPELCQDSDVCHGAEIPLVFLPMDIDFNYTKKDLKLSMAIQSYWTNMAKIGEPGTYDNVNWEPFIELTQYSIKFNENGENKLEQFVSKNKYNCGFWNKLGYFWLEFEADNGTDDGMRYTSGGFGFCVFIVVISMLYGV